MSECCGTVDVEVLTDGRAGWSMLAALLWRLFFRCAWRCGWMELGRRCLLVGFVMSSARSGALEIEYLGLSLIVGIYYA